MNLDIVVSADDNYVQHLMGMLCSLYEHNKSHHIVLHMLRNGSLLQENENFLRGITEKYGHEIKFYNVDETPLQGVQFRKKRPLTMAAYYRLLLPDILQGVDRVLYLDCDMDVMGDVSELLNLNWMNMHWRLVLTTCRIPICIACNCKWKLANVLSIQV
jgi:lipopolysaccharide biosynthesis glycosyltransferase